jgi:hypothetical protein
MPKLILFLLIGISLMWGFFWFIIFMMNLDLIKEKLRRFKRKG